MRFAPEKSLDINSLIPEIGDGMSAAKSTTTYGYDAAGNKTSVAVNAGTNDTGSVTATRTNSSTYSSNFRFLASSTDAAGKVSQYFYNGVAATSFTPALITSIKVVDPNNQSSTTNFDAFGVSTSSSVKGALSGDTEVTGTVSRSFCSGCDSLFPDVYIKVVTSSVTGAEQQQFIDKYGREVGSKTKLPVSGAYSVTRKTYDAQGRLYQSFEPETNAVSSYKSTASYDTLGRLNQTTAANGGVHKVSYSGYSTTYTDALNKTRTVLSNYLGQEQSVTDHNGTVLSYSYNAYGDLLTASSGSITRVSNSYDAYGRKTAMTDVDKGSWSYKTNGFGELVSQTSAIPQTTVFEYNTLGQMTRRYDPSGTVCWSYGSSAAAYNVNQLTAVTQWSASNTACGSASAIYSESYLYNSKALVSSKTITTGGVSYTTSSTYDSYGRPYELTYPTVGSISGPKIRTEYSNGAAYKTTDYSSGSAGVVYHLTTTVNARGQSTGVSYGDKVVATYTYDDATGWLKGSSVNYAPTGATIQLYNYGFDSVGNVTSRSISYGVGSSANLTETFGYDNLHRVTSRTVNTALNLSGNLAMTESYGYDANGNLTNKTNVGYYQYNVSGKPNRLAGVWTGSGFTGTKTYSFTYDTNGNVTNDGKRSFTYTAFEKPSVVTQGTETTSFEYGPNRELIKRIDVRSTGTTSTLMLDGYEQVTLPSGVVEHKYNVGNAIITKRSNGANDTYYLHKDQQGSTTAITNAAGTTVQQFLYDPWGKQYLVNNSLLTYTSPATSQGYTGHEMVNDFEVIHMGGRTYNPTLGRFMQADPFIQSPTNLQSYNRYSYVLNNPMSYTDPSGYFFKKLGKLIKDNWRTLASIAVGYVTFGLGTGIWSLAEMGSLTFGPAVGWGAAAGAASGFVSTGSLRGALSGAISGAAFGAIGASGLGGVESFAVSGLTGGILSDVQGGKFGHGFVSAGIGAAAGGRFGQNPYAQVIGAAVVGGTISAVTGGKFANGAVGAAFAATLSEIGAASSEGTAGDSAPTLKKGDSRGLTDGEISLVNEEFGEGTIDTSKVRIHRKKAYIFHRKSDAMAPDGGIYFHPDGDLYMDDFSRGNIDSQGLFIHEMAHVYQVQSSGKTLWGVAGIMNSYEVGASDIISGRKWNTFNIEQQAQIVKYHFWSRNGAYPPSWNGIRPSIEHYQNVLPYMKQ